VTLEQRSTQGTAVDGGRARLEQVILNLLSNAVKFTGPAAVTITADRGPDGGMRMQVFDTGIGIPEEDLANVFDRFSQVENSYTRKYGGTGLGLHLTKKLVELHDGTIELASAQGTGTTVTITLPPERWHA
jgi:signal transduction histidine kinase